MIDENIYNDYQINSIENKNKFYKKYLTIILIIIILASAIAILIHLFSNKEPEPDIEGKYSLEINDNIVIYMNETAIIPIELEGPDEYTKEAMTELISNSDDMVILETEEFEGKKGSIPIKPLSMGQVDIDVYSTIGVDKYSRLLTNKTMHVIICNALTDNVLFNKQINIKKGKTETISLNFQNNNCFKHITYKSENPSIATVDTMGKITAIKKGKTSITISNQNNSVSLLVNVTN